MAKFKNYDDEWYGDDDGGSFEKIKHTKKQKYKGHQSKHQVREWAVADDSEINFEAHDNNYNSYVKPKTYIESPKPAPAVEQAPKVFTPGPNSHVIKQVTIDYDRVKEMEKISNDYNGVTTFGIKFYFKSKNNTFRVIWFNKNLHERDSVYDTEYSFWQSIKQR